MKILVTIIVEKSSGVWHDAGDDLVVMMMIAMMMRWGA